MGAATGLLFAVRDVSIRDSFILGLIAGMVYFATLLCWLVRTCMCTDICPYG
ncbi:MAG: hypothetical protein R2861_06205 [Desulfobacterales bacterium]